MAVKNSSSARGIHVSPGIYSKETDITYAVKSLGITTLGVVGETLKGPAFQPMFIENWREFQSMFGGTSAEKFAGSQYPKYELPYVAKSYLKESNQLQVCRVLGLSGYNAGPAWVVTASNGGGKKYPVAVLRSRGAYKKYHAHSGEMNCECPQASEEYDLLVYSVGETTDAPSCTSPKAYNLSAVAIDEYSDYNGYGNECEGFGADGSLAGFSIVSAETARFKIKGMRNPQANGTSPLETSVDYFEYSVSLNPSANDYILKVLGTSPFDGDAPLYVESLYDVMLQQLIEKEGVNQINDVLEAYSVYKTSDYNAFMPVVDIVSVVQEGLQRKNVGERYLADKDAVSKGVHCVAYDYASNSIYPFVSESIEDESQTKLPTGSSHHISLTYYKVVTETYTDENGEEQTRTYEQTLSTKKFVKNTDGKYVEFGKEEMQLGQIYTVKQYTDADNKRHYYYAYYLPESYKDEANKLVISDKLTENPNTDALAVLVLNNADGLYYRIDNGDVYPVTCDMNNYKDSYRYASTPWIVSNVKGDANRIELNKLFRFHTISDGDTANKEVKISIQNIKTDEGTFEVAVRDINDTDQSPIYLERFTKCSMKVGDAGYIAYKIGSYDGLYESKSKYITVEVNESLAAQSSVPAGFLGYPLSNFNGREIVGENAHADMNNPQIVYNLNYDVNLKNRKQYFGLSNHVGVDVDMFTYKGKAAYINHNSFLSQGFHLDARLDMAAYTNEAPVVTVDGEKGYRFDAVKVSNKTPIYTETPIIGTEAEMEGSIYEFVDLRKFTVYFYGGFDGWDIYRDYRSNTDDFKMTNYRGNYNEATGVGDAFDTIINPENLGLDQVGFTSDWYAYLAGIRQFANPEAVDINVFATPGIDMINNKTLVEEAIEMIEEERADSIYVVTMPDKPFGASEYTDEMYTADDVVYALEDTEIDSNYACTYYPWVKYEDTDNNQFIFLPPTKDVVRNLALTDNTAFPWFAPAGLSRGDVECARARYITKLADEDVLYEGRINPIKTFASDGVKIWGQKNLQVRESQLNRIAVRRLLLRMRKLVAIGCLGLIFDPNDATTKNKFMSIVTPIMDNLRANRAISDYRIEVNDTVESRERRELPARILFKPYNALEYIVLDFVVTPEAVSFDNI